MNCIMKKILIPLLSGLLLLSSGLSLAQTRVVKTNAMKSNDYGVQYFLPKTVLKMEVNYSKITQQAGTYARYAGKLLGMNETDIIQENQTLYVLNSISIEGVGVPDKNESYLVAFKTKTTAPFVYLTEEGLICTINAEYTPETPKTRPASKETAHVNTIDVQSLFTEEYLQAGSVSKMAEVLAKQIYRIRESRNDILLGEAENAPRDGEGMRIVLNNLEAQEKALTALFTGTTSRMEESARFEIEPHSDISKEVLFRFSKYGGVVDSDDLSGSPVYINVKAIEPIPAPLVDAKRKEKEPLSIVYNIPVKSSVEVFYSDREMCREEILIAQFGEKQILATSIFEDKKVPTQVFFYPATGAIKQVVQ